MLVSIGILAHNEADKITSLISDLGNQTLLVNERLSIEIHVVANGCTDATVAVSKEALTASVFQRKNVKASVQNIERAGKSNAWNELVHTFASPRTEYMFFLDADIHIPEDTTLQLMLDGLIGSKNGCVAVDQSVKDLSEQVHKTAVEKLILAASGTAYDNRTALAGALYCVRFEVLRNVWMPIGLPGEDGFLRAMILTSNFTQNENLERIIYVDGARHIFESARTINDVFRHNIRLAIGTAVNVLLFKHIRASRSIQNDVGSYIRQRNAADPNWVNELIANEIKGGRYFLLHGGFLTKRLHRLSSRSFSEQVRKAPITMVGLVFDVALFFTANHMMRRGAGAGYW
jgi:glycosyltransferase involved in cell wall biosynthesis